MAAIDRKTLEHLAELARIKLGKGEEDKLLQDLKKILDYFGELKELNTANVEPLAGGTDLKNVLRNDEDAGAGLSGERAREAFPETKDGFLKIPPVFE